MMRYSSSLCAIAVSMLAACSGLPSTITRPPCAVAKLAPVDFGPPAAQSATVSVVIEIRDRYVIESVRARIDTPLPASASDADLAIPQGAPGAIATTGALVKSVALQESTANGTRTNTLAVQIVPWLLHKEADPQNAGRWLLSKTEVQRFFTLRLGLRPRIQPPTGIIVPLELVELHDDSQNQTVSCSTTPDVRNPGYDIVTAQVHQGVLDALDGTPDKPAALPLSLPAATVINLISGIAGAQLNLTGVALGSDQDLTIGMLFDQGSPLPFSSQSGLSAFPDDDWGVLIDPSFITTAVKAKVSSAATKAPQKITLGPLSVSYQSQPDIGGGRDNLISVTGSATAQTLMCRVGLSISANVSPLVCRATTGKSSLVGCTTSKIDPHVNACIVFERILYGEATATVCSPGPCPDPPSPCSPMADIQFDVGPGDTFYATDVETTPLVFQLVGRSTFLDGRLPARPALAACPP